MFCLGCDDTCEPESGAVYVALGDTIQLDADKVYWLDAAEFGLEYDNLKNDSRCPVNVNCIWEGDATVVFNISCVDKVSLLELHQYANYGNSALLNGVTVKLIDILPYKIDPDTLSWNEYHPVVTFLSDK